MLKYFFLVLDIFALTTPASVSGLFALNSSTVQLECPYAASDGRRIVWKYSARSIFKTYSEGNMINPTFAKDLKERLQITGNHTKGEYHLNISDIRESDEGTYECTLSGSIGIHTEQLTVILEPVSVNIDNVLPDDKLSGTEGLNLIITCRAVGGKPPPNVKLTISGTIVATGNQSLQHTFSTISRSYDRKAITCYAGHDVISHYPLIDSAKLYLFLKPLPPIFTQSFVVTEETVPLNVSCTSLGSRPAANFTWLIGKNNFDVTSNSYESSTLNSSTETFTVTSTLIYKFSRTYNGQLLTCKASNIISSNISSSKLLNIKYAPSVGVENKTFQQRGTIRNVQCSIQGNPSEYTYFNCSHNSFYGVTIRKLPIGQNGILTLPEVPMEFGYQDSGIYVCTVGNGILGTNGQEKQTGYGFVKIQSRPVFVKTNVKKITVMIGTNVDVDIYAFSEPKYTFIKWYRNTTPLSQSAKFNMLEKIMIVDDDFHGKGVQLDGYKLTLVINAFRIEDATFYRLLLSNGIGEVVEHIMFLEIGNIPQTPKNITIVSVGETGLTIQWVPVDDEDYQLIYHIEHKLSISSMWVRKEINVRDIEISNTKLLYELVGLQTSTYYDVRIVAENSFNKSLPSAIITAKTLSKANTDNAIQSASIPMVALGTSSTIITIVAWLVVGWIWFKRKTTSKAKGNKTDSTSHRSNIQMYDVVTDPARIQTDQPKEMSDTSMAAYESLGLKDKPNVYSEL
ncbi:protein turtle-like [Mytilus edulis]|uniref:protein turtle-like n=1 Tax=Mytilus edulis TaxID=6550 RepID=UPI0039EF3813